MNTETQLDLLRWLAERNLAGDDEAELLAGFARRLCAGGVPLDRAFAGVEMVHPLVDGQIFHWESADDSVRRMDLDRFDEDETRFQASPLYQLQKSGSDSLRRRLDGRGEPAYRRGEFPLLDELADEGFADYFALAVRMSGPHAIGERDETFLTFASRAGFDDEQLALLRAVAPNLVAALRGATGPRMAYALMECYLGRDAGRRVLRGGIERGRAEELHAVLWYSDLRGFTKVADSAEPDAVIPMLNAYAEVQADAVHGRGGQVLKFMGDGVLAIFPIADGLDAPGAALDALNDVLARQQRLNADRAGAGLPVSSLYFGLHVGRVLYGNIGSADRLDFTVVGPAVNEVSRIAGMTKALEKDVLISAAFAETGLHCRHRIVSMGRYALRGVRQPQELFTLEPGT